jgi:hypothetical protein
MKELDLLKKDWQKNQNSFEQVSETEIYKMIHEKSSSSVKWILIISILELAFGFMIALAVSFTKYEAESVELIHKLGIYKIYVATSVLMYAVIFYFIYKFYQMYKKISVVDNTSQLMSSIVNTRKIVKQYIAFNLSAFFILSVALYGYMFYDGYMDALLASVQKSNHFSEWFSVILFIAIVIICGILTLCFWLFYRLLYGFLLRRLYTNYKELKKIDL